MPFHKEIDVSMCNGMLRIWLGDVAHLLISLNHRMGGLNRVRGLNERMPFRIEIDVSMCNGILRIWLGHFGSSAHLIGDRMVSFETIRSTSPRLNACTPLPPGRGLNERMPLHKEINVSMCNGILRIWLGHFASSAHLI